MRSEDETTFAELRSSQGLHAVVSLHEQVDSCYFQSSDQNLLQKTT